MNTATAPRFRFIGVTDEQTTCDHCGRTELARTVVLAALDADGTPDEVLHFGTTCAARALAQRFGTKMTRTAVVNAAVQADCERRAADTNARQLLGFYGLPLAGRATPEAIEVAAERYAEAHRAAVWASQCTREDWVRKVRAMLVRRQAEVIA